MADIDILSIHSKILGIFDEEESKLESYRDQLSAIEKTLEIPTLRIKMRRELESAQNKLQEHYDSVESGNMRNFYVSDTLELIEQYKQLVKKPERVVFMGKASGENKEKKAIVTPFLNIAQKYVDIEIPAKEKSTRISCPNCSNKKDFDVLDNDIHVCVQCYAQQYVSRHRASSYHDIDRVNISSKYMYDRKVHFRDCINQYQGKQNSTVPQEVYDALETEFARHHLLPDNCENMPREEKFCKITKEHILMFLRELEYTKHYENLHLIHYNLTGIKPDDISHLEDQLLDDFDALTELYDKHFKHNSRKNFINTQYVLYQLLTRHKHQCKMQDFTILKTIDRKAFHDDVARVLFNSLGWNFKPIC